MRRPATHRDSGSPQFLNALRVCDVPVAVGLLAPRPLVLVEAPDGVNSVVKGSYAAAGAEGRLMVK